MLEKIGMDNECVIGHCCDNFKILYWLRCGKKFRRSSFRENVALATSVFKQLVRLGVPRPPSHIADLCGLYSSSVFFHVEKILRIEGREKVKSVHLYLGFFISLKNVIVVHFLQEEIRGWFEHKEPRPQDYLWTLCACLYLPYWLPASAEQLMVAANVRWVLFGTNPVHVAAGVLLSAAAKFGQRFSESVNIKTVCSTLGCSVKPVRKVIRAMPEYEFECDKSLEEIGENWVERKMLEKASNIKCNVKTDMYYTPASSGIRPQFKKSKREELLEHKRQVQLKRMQDRNYAAFQRRWQHLLVQADWTPAATSPTA